MNGKGIAGIGGLIVLSALVRASAIMPERRADHDADVKRFGLDQPEPARRARSPDAARQALSRFNTQSRGAARMHVSPRTGAYSAQALGGALTPPRPGAPAEVARSFLEENKDVLGVAPADLLLERSQSAGGITHLLYRQTKNGLPVEFSRLKVHIAATGEVIGFDSGEVSAFDVPPTPWISEGQAAAAVAADVGGAAPQGGALVYLPVHKTGEVRLAWRFKVQGPRALWRYYIDAQTGAVLFRYNDLRFQTCPTQEFVKATVFDIDPSSTPVAVRPMPFLNVLGYNTTAPMVTDVAGGYCLVGGVPGKITASLQGAFANVANANRPAAHYDNAAGMWCTAATPISSPQPYANGTFPVSEVHFTVIVAPTPPPAPCPPNFISKSLPRFSFFEVGAVSGEGDILDDDQLQVTDVNKRPIASYVGGKSAFNGAAVMGRNPTIGLRLVANPTTQRTGYSVGISSYLVLTNAPTVSANGSFMWTSTHAYDNNLDEVNSYYHITQMHEYFRNGVNAAGQAPIDEPVVVMAHAGPNLGNAFFNPDHNNIFIGDLVPFALDATVVHHEYVHYMVDKIYPILNFGQHGAISEALADYFAASSLNDPSIGKFVVGAFGSEGSLRELECDPGDDVPPCRLFPTQWVGEIHDDSVFLSQALWEIRQQAPAGCADQLAFQAHFFFPDSFREFLDSMLQVSARAPVLAPACGVANQQSGLVQARFAAHGITSGGAGGDAFEPNDGAATATDVTNQSQVTATLFPTADHDFYAFGAAPGAIEIQLNLPANPAVPTAFFAYQLVLVDRKFRVVAEALPPIDINPTQAGTGLCPIGTNPQDACLTTASKVVLKYNNPAAEQFYLLVIAAPTDELSPSGTNSTVPYSLHLSYLQAGALSGSIVTATFDKDVFNFNVDVSSFVRYQNFDFVRALLRDHNLHPLPGTETDNASPTDPGLAVVTVSTTGGRISGQLRLKPGFAERFPALGTVHLEVLGINTLQRARRDDGDPTTLFTIQSFGLSNPINLTTNRSALTAYNNVFNPGRGERTTLKYETMEAGRVRLRLFSLNGALVATLLDADVPAGKGAVDWNGTSTAGATVSSGIYLLHLEAPGIRRTQKVVVVK